MDILDLITQVPPRKPQRSVDFDFIKGLEGFETEGYVPAPETSQSGVTIASGFDLGARNREDLERIGLPSELIKRLSPYLGKKKQDAAATLRERPLKISEEEAELLNREAKQETLDRLEKAFNEESDTPFRELPPEAQTAISSVAFQYGDLPSRTPSFWKQITTGDMKGALKELKNFGDDYKTRRLKEAELLSNLFGA